METQSDLTPNSMESLEALRGIWEAQGQTVASIGEVCDTPKKKTCRNADQMTFEGYAEEGGDVREAWRGHLARDGKSKGGSLADLILGPQEDR
jgi:hypothetical protein